MKEFIRRTLDLTTKLARNVMYAQVIIDITAKLELFFIRQRFHGFHIMEVAGAQAAYRVLDLLTEVGCRDDGITATEAASVLGISLPTTHRLLKVLCDRRFVQMTAGDKRYVRSDGPGYPANTVNPEFLTTAANAILESLRDETGETVFLSQRQGLSVRYLLCLPSERSIRLFGAPGMLVPLHASSQGKVALAFSPPDIRERLLNNLDMFAHTERTITDPKSLVKEIERVRSLGYATNVEEHELGTHSVSAPVLNSNGEAVAAVCIGGPKFRVEQQHLSERLAPLAIDAAGRIASSLI